MSKFIQFNVVNSAAVQPLGPINPIMINVEDIDYDNKHGHSDESMTADEKHISKLAGDLKYDEKK